MGGGGGGWQAVGVARGDGNGQGRGGAGVGVTGGDKAAARRSTPRYGSVEGTSRVPFGAPDMVPCIALGNGARDKPPSRRGVRTVDLRRYPSDNKQEVAGECRGSLLAERATHPWTAAPSFCAAKRGCH